MHFALTLASLFAFTGVATAQFCAEAARFGFHQISQTTIAVGQTFTLTSNYTCSFAKGVRPSEVDYILRNTVNNNGHEPNIVLARRYNPTVVDIFNATLPKYTYFNGAQYSIQTLLTYPSVGAQIQGYTADYSVTVTPFSA